MIKKIFITIFIMIPLVTSAQDAVQAADAAEVSNSDTVPLDKCNATNIAKCDTIPVHEEVPLKESAVIKSDWGSVFMASTPREALTPGGLNVEVEVKVQCKNETQKRVVIPKMTVCSYPKVTTRADLEVWAFHVIHDPVLNIVAQGDTITLRYNKSGAPDAVNNCGPEAAPKVVKNPCVKSAPPH